jgi:hypothetical protein
LALYIGLAGLAPGLKRIEGKIQVMLDRLASIDGAARELDIRRSVARLHYR